MFQKNSYAAQNNYSEYDLQALKIAKEDVDPTYDEYLRFIQERNRIIKKLKAKDSQQIELERKEQGFALYINGANADVPALHLKSKHRMSKTAGENGRGQRQSPAANYKDISDIVRARTAPGEPHRKNWSPSSVKLKTARGEKVSVRAPDILTGDYYDDFESDVSCSYRTDADSEISNTLMLSVQDVKKLRQSLEMNASLIDSLCYPESESDKSASDDEEYSDDTCGKKPGDKPPRLKADDVIVLEFASNSDRKSRRLPSVQRKDLAHIQLKKAERTRTEFSQEGENFRSSRNSIIELKATTPSRRQRPLSASRLVRSSQQDPADEAAAVVSAMRSENKTIVSPRPVQSAPSLGSKSQESQEVLSNRSVDKTGKESNLDDIVHKVLQLDDKGQRNLIKALSQIEYSAADMNDDIKPSHTGPVKAIAPIAAMVKPFEPDVGPVVKLDLHSNWGHENRIGLTEIQLFGRNGNRLQVESDSVRVDGISTPCASLFNCKTKTVRERNMWTCNFDPTRTVTMEIRLCKEQVQEDYCGLSKITLWNYNRNLNDLAIGVRHLSVSVGDNLVFEGELEKGCGNQVFDYGRTIWQVDLLKDEFDTSEKKQLDIPPLNLAKSDDVVDDDDELSTPTMDNVSLESHDWDQLRSETRLMHRGAANDGLCRPTVSDTSPTKHSSKKKEEKGEEKISGGKTRKKKTPRKSKIVARLDGSVENTASASSSLMSSKNVISDSAKAEVDAETSQSRTVRKSSSKAVSRQSQETAKSAERTNTKQDSKARRKSKDNSVREAPVKSKASEVRDDQPRVPVNGECVVSPPKNILSPVRQSLTPGTPASDDESMLQQIRRITSEKIGPKPNWLGRVEQVEKVDESDDLENWLEENLELLPTLLDVDSAPPRGSSPSHGRRSARDQYQDAASKVDNNNIPENLGIEASWASLNIFDRSQKGRISIDMQNDILDEYLQTQQKTKTSTAEITEELPPTTDEDVFVIPELPAGKELVINILSTWGDRHYVGLNGVEIFTKTGELARVAKTWAEPSDINVLPEYSNDPRVVSNITDGVNRTRDDTHMWLAPFTSGATHKVFLQLERTSHVAMMRIWNYNKSRIHSYRGARRIEVTLDGAFIFKGEITRACGGIVGSAEQFGDTILFTMDDSILELVSRHDKAFEIDYLASDGEEDQPQQERPTTADGGDEKRPYTTAHGREFQTPFTPEEATVATSPNQQLPINGQAISSRAIRLNFTHTWGDPYYLGLTGLELAGKDGEPVPVTMAMVHADPRDLHVLPGYEKDDRTLDKLFDCENLTMSDEHMWLIPYTEGENHVLEVTLPEVTALSGIRFWNYNKSPEDTFRGAKVVHIQIDGVSITPPEGVLLRKGPGNVCFDFAQEISFLESLTPAASQDATSIVRKPKASQEYESVMMPKGFIYQFHLVSTWGDQYYVGLNGLEFYDQHGSKISLSENHISAYPDSINWLEGVEGDARTPDKLVDGIHDTTDAQHMWLAPIVPSMVNRVYVIFDKPTTISMIKIWNYSKSARRGVKDFALLVDDLLVYNGILQRVNEAARGILPTCDVPQQHHTILFTDCQDIIGREKNTTLTNTKGEEQDVQMLNDREIITKRQEKPVKPANQALRPTTSVPGNKSKLRK